ncbi:ROK family protein [Pseudomonas putida]|uniref:ROK family protein n=1 Tax=Pseudomonas putida TaxID=303 RepID=UPI0016289F7E|nr:ROK family protein [Pseudomonas putida]QNG10120.1 ROK family protein [Pseudomonas putida]HDS1061481.1 ROK family protein [Pseudomonas putida]
MHRAPEGNEIIIGADLGGTKLLLLCGAHSRRFGTGPGYTPEDFATQLRAFIEDVNLRPVRIGIAVPGLVARDGEIVSCDVLPCLTGWRPETSLKALGCQITVINDVKAALLEEMQDVSNDFTGGVIMAGTAIGAAFMTQGRELRGVNGWAGELGYLPLHTDGSVKRLDEVAGGGAMATQMGLSGEALAQLANDNDALAMATVKAGGEALGIGMASVINLLNPSRLAVGGGALKLKGYWEAALRTAQAHAIPPLWDACSVTRVKSGHFVAALGSIRAAQRDAA